VFTEIVPLIGKVDILLAHFRLLTIGFKWDVT